MKILLILLIMFLQQDPEVTPEVEYPILDTVQAYFTASTITPLIGEPFTLTLTAETPLDIEIIEWGELSAPFEIQEASGIHQSTDDDGISTYQQTIQVVIWRVGDYTTPQLYIGYRIMGDEQVYRVPVQNISFSVPSILETQDLNQLQPHPYKPPIGLFYVPVWVMIILLLVLGGVIWWIWQWWEKRRLRLMILPEPTPYELALEILKTGDLRETVPISLKTYLEGRFKFPAHQLTTPEIIQALQHQISEPMRDTLWTLLEHSDILKYSGIHADNNEQLLTVTVDWLEQMEETSL